MSWYDLITATLSFLYTAAVYLGSFLLGEFINWIRNGRT